MSYLDMLDDDANRRERTAGDYSSYGGGTTSYDPGGGYTSPTGGAAGGYTPPNGNTGVSGYGNGGMPMPALEPEKKGTKTMPLDLNKLNDPAHAAKSPKYDFMQLVNTDRYGYNDLGSILKSLQSGPNGRLWDGWSYNGSDKYQFTGDPSRLAPEWDGAKFVDTVSDYGGPGQAWIWGVDEGPNSGGAGGGFPGLGGMGGSGGAGLPGGVLGDAISKLQAMFEQPHPGMDRFNALADARLNEINDPAKVEARRALARTSLQEPIEAQRAAGQQHALERASNRGLGLTSGVLEQEAQGIDQGYDRMLGQGFRDLAIDDLDRTDAHGKESVGIGQLMATLGMAQEAQQLGPLTALLGGGQFLEQLPIQKLLAGTGAMGALDNQTIPNQSDPAGLIGLLLAAAGQGEGAANTAQGQNSAFWANLFAQLPGLFGAMGGGK